MEQAPQKTPPFASTTYPSNLLLLLFLNYLHTPSSLRLWCLLHLQLLLEYGYPTLWIRDNLLEYFSYRLTGHVGQRVGGYVLTHSAIRPIGQWDATAGWAGPYTNGANDRPIHQSGDHNNILILLFHTELWNKPNK